MAPRGWVFALLRLPCALRPETGAAELARLRRAQTVLALVGFDLSVLGCAKG